MVVTTTIFSDKYSTPMYTSPIESNHATIPDKNSITSTANIVIPVKLEDYTVSSGYKSAMGMYVCLAIVVGCALIALLFNSSFISGIGLFVLLIFIILCGFSIHHNKVNMDKKDDNGIKQIDKYYNKDVNQIYINAGWIFPTIILAIPLASLVISAIVFMIIHLKNKIKK